MTKRSKILGDELEFSFDDVQKEYARLMKKKDTETRNNLVSYILLGFIVTLTLVLRVITTSYFACPDH